MGRTIKNGLVIIALFITANAFVQKFDLSKSIEQGKETYTTYCQNCHMANGQGMTGVFPPLEKSDYLRKPLKSVVEVITKGQTGEVTVNGIKFMGTMPPQDYLSDEQIADILNYVYKNWGNKSSGAITPAMVKKARG